MSFQQKYLKYKSKYFLSKNQVGGNMQNIFNILVSRAEPELNYKVYTSGIIKAGYLSNDPANFTALDNPEFTAWCNSLVGGSEINEKLVIQNCNELWPYFLAHFNELATYDRRDNFSFENNDRTKLIRRWIEYFTKAPEHDTNKKPTITDEELRVFFCDKFNKAVKDTIIRKIDEVPANKLHHLFYMILRDY